MVRNKNSASTKKRYIDDERFSIIDKNIYYNNITGPVFVYA